MQTKKIAQILKILIKLWKTKGFIFIFLFLITYLTFFWSSPYILNYFQKTYHQKFIFYSVSEPLVSILKFSFVLTFLIFFPLVWYVLLFSINLIYAFKKKFFWSLFFLGLFLFYLGAIFAYEVTFPFGIKFLLSFRTEKIEPAISLGHFVNFFSFFILAFGLIFEMPLLIAFLSLSHIINPYKLSKYRKEIFFIIVIVAAVITPTPDAFNLSLLAVPLYLLFEFGLVLSKFLKKVHIFSEITTISKEEIQN